MTLKVIETFSGIGAQAKALENISKKNHNFKYKIVATCEWEIGAIYAYDLIHNGKQNLIPYDKFSKIELINSLKNLNLSSNGKDCISLKSLERMPIIQLQSIKHSIDKNNNLIDITKVKAKSLPYSDLLTYSFPCQDLSISSFWWNNSSGIDPNSGNRSSLLWQIGRILNEFDNINKKKPNFLLMENVTAIQSPRHSKNFNNWIQLLENHGYTINFPIQLNAKNFGIPQNRNRTYMISIQGGYKTKEIHKFLENYNFHTKNRDLSMNNFLKLDYENPIYLSEALTSTPNYTPSRKRIHSESIILAKDDIFTGEIAKTITTKQDRLPNAGIIEHKLYSKTNMNLSPYRNLTPRETFLLMGFDEKDFNIIQKENISVSKNRKFLNTGKLLKLSGNSIVVNVLEELFILINHINDSFF